jgi:Protein of unknown function (DUF2934)
MFNLKANNDPNSYPVIGPVSSAPEDSPALASGPLQEEIRLRAYELYEGRRREQGQDKEDWLRAEQEISLTGQRLGLKIGAA